MTQVHRVRDLLKQVSIFTELPQGELHELANRVKERTYPAGSLIVGQEDKGDALYVVADGRVKVVLYGDESGREVILSMFRPGDFFGEMALLDNQPRSANVIAVEDSRLLILERHAFVNHLIAHPRAALNIMAEMSRRLRRADEIIGNLALLDVYGRVARLLRELARTEGEETDEGIVIRSRPTQAEIAAMIGTSRETVSRALSDFARRGLISMNGKRIVLRRGFHQVAESGHNEN